MDKGKMLTVRGNVCEPQRINRDEFVIIPHCCNTIGVMGAGVALGLKTKWPVIEKKYSESRLVLGNIFWENVGNDIAVINMIGQKGVRSADNPKPVKYSALVRAMKEIVSCIRWTPMAMVPSNTKIVFHCPMFGSDLAGGNWELILELIREIWVDEGFDVVIYEFEQDPDKWGPIGDISREIYAEEKIEDMSEVFLEEMDAKGDGEFEIPD